jgi:hypothetical protein
VELTWDADVEQGLAAALGAVPARERERALESSMGRIVRPCLRTGRRPARARVRQTRNGLVAELESR